MKDLLSNEEIDTLLEMFRADGPPMEAEAKSASSSGSVAAARTRVVSPVDLLKPNRIARDQMRALERIFETSAKTIAATVSEKLRFEVICDCVAVEQLRFRGWLSLLTEPSAIYVLEMQPLQQPVLFTVTSSLLYAAVDRVLGGTGKVAKVPKDFTAAEYTVADAFVLPCLDRLAKGLESMVPMRPEVVGRFCNPSMAQILPNQDVVLSVHFQTSGEAMVGDLRFVVPFAALEPHVGRLDLEPGTAKNSPGAMRESLTHTVERVPVEFSVVLGEAELPLRQLLALQRGDVVPLRTRVGEPLVAPVQGRAKFRGQIGTQGQRLAFQVGAVLGDQP